MEKQNARIDFNLTPNLKERIKSAIIEMQKHNSKLTMTSWITSLIETALIKFKKEKQ